MSCELPEKFYLSVIAVFSLVSYYVLVFQSWITRFDFLPLSYFYLTLIHLLLFMFIWAIVTTIVVQPGSSEVFWGFYMTQTENRKKKYCLVCHIFKPERCHHCSKCKRCILGMDHHCPWLCSCIGYFNRRHFMQTLFYGSLSLTVLLAFNTPRIYRAILFLSKIVD